MCNAIVFRAVSHVVVQWEGWALTFEFRFLEVALEVDGPCEE